MTNQRRGVAWDLDGVIVDSAEAHNASWTAMSQEYGVQYDPERDFPLIFGRHNTDIITSLWGISEEAAIARMTDAKETHFRKEAASLPPLPGVLRLMEEFAANGWKQAIGSSAPMENVRLLLKAAGVERYIDAIASGDDVTRGKPDPQVFLLAFSLIGVEPQNGVVIEDAPAGIQAGRNAGATCIGVTTTQSRETLQKAGAHLVVETLEGLSMGEIRELFDLR